MIDNEMPFVQTNATVVTIFAGVNEINTITSALGGGEGGSDPNAYIDAQVKAFGNDYTTLIAGIRARAGIAAHRHPERAERRRPAVPGRRVARAAPGGAARRRRHDAGPSSTPLVSSSITVVDLMCDARSYVGVQLLVRRPAPERRRLRVHLGGSRQGDHRQLVSRAAKQLQLGMTIVP